MASIPEDPSSLTPGGQGNGLLPEWVIVSAINAVIEAEKRWTAAESSGRAPNGVSSARKEGKRIQLKRHRETKNEIPVRGISKR